MIWRAQKLYSRTLTLADVRQAIQSKQVSALLVVIPLAEKYLSLVRGFFQLDHKKVPVLIPIESAGRNCRGRTCLMKVSTSQRARCGDAPPVPEDDLTTLRTALYLVAQQEARHRSGHPPHADDHERAQGPSASSSRSSRRSPRPAPTRMPTFRCILVRPPSTTAPRRASWMSTATGSI